MSYDLIFYFRRKPVIPPLRHDAEVGISIGGPYPVVAEDVDARFRRFAKGSRYSIDVCCSGGPENFEALGRLRDEIVSRNKDVVVVDNQIGVVFVDGQEFPYDAPTLLQKTSIALSIYFENGPEFEERVFDSFLGLMQRLLPQALPRRYGPEEPAKFTLKKHGLEHFKAEWRKHPTIFVWLPHSPFEFVATAVRNDRREFPDRPPNDRNARGYRCSMIEVQGKVAPTDEASLLLQARDFLAEAAILTNAFYAEVVRDWRQWMHTSWWWHGVPQNSPSVVIVGEPYLTLWSEFASISRPLGIGHRLASNLSDPTTGTIAIPSRLADPREKAHPRAGDELRYADVFPFKAPEAAKK